MSYHERLSDLNIAISVSESPDMPSLGLSDEHLRDAMTEVARHLLALGSRLAYGGDLRAHGFTELLFELVARHRRDAEDGDDRPGVTNYLAWPVHISQAVADLERLKSDLENSAELVLLSVDGRRSSIESRNGSPALKASEAQWAEGLTSMRNVMRAETNARIVLGGRTERYMGVMPGIAEEALISLETQQPLFLIGGFGGCTRDIARLLGLLKANDIGRPDWANHEAFSPYSGADLNNGLSEEENITLATTPHIDQAVTLILRGLIRAADSDQARSKEM